MKVAFAREFEEQDVVFEGDVIGDIGDERFAGLSCADVPAVDEDLRFGGGGDEVQVVTQADIANGFEVESVAQVEAAVKGNDIAGIVGESGQDAP